MRFVIIYHNRDDVRGNIVQLIGQFVSQGMNFALGPMGHPIFNSRPFWPSDAEISRLPLTTQCEEVIWTGTELQSLRKLVVDAEIIEAGTVSA